MKIYYLPFLPAANIDYLRLLSLYDLAEYRIETKAFDFIRYTSQQALAAQLNISPSTASRLLKDNNYQDFIEVDTENKVILLKNSFINETKRPFVRLTAAEVELIRKQNDNLFAKYLIYMKYFCGYTKNNTDFTAKQFLLACGYSVRSNDTLNKVSSYNSVLVENKIIRIETYRDELGHTRNKYSYI